MTAITEAEGKAILFTMSAALAGGRRFGRFRDRRLLGKTNSLRYRKNRAITVVIEKVTIWNGMT